MRPDTEVKLILPAMMIPDGSTVTKATGSVAYTLRHTLTLYQHQGAKAEPIKIAGTFLIGDRDVSQIAPDSLLALWGTAESIRDLLTDQLEQFDTEDK